MDTHDMLSGHEWKILERFGLKNSFWTLQADTLTSTYFIIFIVCILSLYINRCLKNEQSRVRFVTLQYVQNFRDLISQTLKVANKNHVAFIGSIFTFIILCSCVQIFPTLEEPTKDLNTTFGLGLIAFFYIHGYGLRVHGLKDYIKEYFTPFFIMFPLHLVGTFTPIISLSFRLFGNIFGGFVITSLYNSMVSGSILLQFFSLFSGINFLLLFAFGLFEGAIQAFVFSMLTLTYLSIRIVSEDEGDDHV